MNNKSREKVKYENKVMIGRRNGGATKALGNEKGMSLDFARTLHESLLILTLRQQNETMVQKERQRSRIKAMHMNSLWAMIRVRKSDRIKNERMRAGWCS